MPNRRLTPLDKVRRKVTQASGPGQTSIDGTPLHSNLSLEDKIPPRAHTIFVGINPAISSAQRGHYYAHPSNKFWSILHASGISPVPLKPEDDNRLVEHGFGFTDVAKRPTPDASALQYHDYADARDRLRLIAKTVQPNTIAFVSKMAARAYLSKDASHVVRYGPQSFSIHGAKAWFLPSTSGQSYRDTSYEEKVAEFRRLADHVRSYFTWEL